MKILFVSNHNPHFLNTNFYREKALKALGHHLVFFEDRNFLIPGRIRKKINLLQNWDLKRLNKKLVKLARIEKPDIFLVVGGHRVLPETIPEIKTLDVETILWTSDAPKDFDNITQVSHPLMRVYDI